jgi:PPOX class probable F420-dependent enzyme
VIRRAGYGLRVRLSGEETRRRFAASRSAVLGTADADGRPHLVPVTFAVSGDTAWGDSVLIAVDSKPKRTTDLKRLRNIAANPAVSLLADRYDDDWSRLWWARADGAARIAAEPDALPAGLLAELRGRYPQYADNAPGGPFILVTVERWSGWSFADQ